MEGPCKKLGAPQTPRLHSAPWTRLPYRPQRRGGDCFSRSIKCKQIHRLKGHQVHAVDVLDQPVTDVKLKVTSFGIPEIWKRLAVEHGDLPAINDPHQSPPAKYTFRELYSELCQFASGLKEIGLKQGDVVALFSENSSRWLVADQSIMMLGAADAVRGSSGSVDEMSFIIRHSGSCGIVVQDAATLERLMPGLKEIPSNGSSSNGSLQDSLQFVVVLWGEVSAGLVKDLRCPVYTFKDVLAKSHGAIDAQPIPGDTLATLVYTSGTTGSPKGVELTHANILYQIANLPFFLGVTPGDSVLSLLPPWHIYERTCSYYILSCGGQQVYTSIRKFKEDLTIYPPDHFVCVPLVLESLYTKVMQQLRRGSAVKQKLAFFFLAASTAYIKARRVVQGVALQFARQNRPLRALLSAYFVSVLLAPVHRLGSILVYKKIRQALGIRHNVVSGGGSLAAHLDDFYELIGLEVLNGWGLSETAPVLACRQRGPSRNVRGSIGLPIPQTTLRVVDPTTLEDVADGELGLILAQGPGVMRGYRNDRENTQKAMRAGDGFFDTGDLGWRAPDGINGSNMAGTIVLTGRSKDTIVLSNGENIEPQPIEDACCASAYISNMLVVGQDKRMLGALVAPNNEAFEELEKAKGKLSWEEKQSVLKSEISRLTSSRPSREKVIHIGLLPKALDREDGTLTQTLKPRRQAVFAKYSSELESLMQKLR